MKVFMLGWEFPPYISGGVGAACQGLTQALLDAGVDVLFMLPRPVKPQMRPRVQVVRQMLPAVPPPPPIVAQSANGSMGSAHGAEPVGPAGTRSGEGARGVPSSQQFPYVPPKKVLDRMRVRAVDAMLWPYLTPEQYQDILVEREEMEALGVTPPPDPLPAHALAPRAEGVGVPGHGDVNRDAASVAASPSAHTGATGAGGKNGAPITQPPQAPPEPKWVEREEVVMEPYAPSLLEETHRYARIAAAVAAKETFDVVHAHDWMTFEAARAVAAARGVPLVVQIHATEYDRAPYSPDPMVVGTERAGMLAADAVIAVSHRVKGMLVETYGVPAEKIEVIYNAVDAKDEDVPRAAGEKPVQFRPRGKLVLFLGRITAQKGPEHFLAAARKVLEVYPDVTFVMAGDGDRRAAMEALATDLGIADKVMFTGFLSKPEVETLFRTADVYVMPSVSEPFGLVSLEALRNDVPVIISRQSGVAELLNHVLKVDFWDTEELANKIAAVLRHPSLAATLREEGQHEVGQLTWHDAARQTVGVYERLTGAEEGETEKVGAGGSP